MAQPIPPSTCFAPAERVSRAELERQAGRLGGLSGLRVMLDAVPNVVMTLNLCRQLVYCNRALLQWQDLPDARDILGLRPGEILRCVHSCETEGGCGTSEFCRACGAAKAIVAAQSGRQAVEECHILRMGRAGLEALDLRVWASPLEYDGESFTVFSALDVGHEKRRAVLERVFLHDVSNLLVALYAAAELGRDGGERGVAGLMTMIGRLTRSLAEEVQAHRDLVAAESSDLRPRPAVVHSVSLLEQVAEVYGGGPAAYGKRLCLAGDTADVELISDEVLLRRVIGNMVKNALEACREGERVTLGCRAGGGRVEFWVHNPGEIAREAQLQLFQRSFSTKGPGRGLGTYSIKLLTERYLQGRVSFSSSAGRGTEFVVSCPLRLEPEASAGRV